VQTTVNHQIEEEEDEYDYYDEEDDILPKNMEANKQ
jgi:hypothetical protein